MIRTIDFFEVGERTVFPILRNFGGLFRGVHLLLRHRLPGVFRIRHAAARTSMGWLVRQATKRNSCRSAAGAVMARKPFRYSEKQHTSQLTHSNEGICTMPIVNGNYYMNGEYGQGLEQARIGDAFPGLADQSGASNSWADRLIDHLTTPRSATEPPPPPAPPGMPPEAYDDMKVNQLTVRQVANVIANEDRDVTPGTSSPEDFYQSKLWKAHAIINADRTYGDQRFSFVKTASNDVTPELENSPQYQQALAASRQAFQEQLSGKTRPAAGCGSITERLLQHLAVFSTSAILRTQQSA